MDKKKFIDPVTVGKFDQDAARQHAAAKYAVKRAQYLAEKAARRP